MLKSVCEYLQQTVERFPQKVALVAGNGKQEVTFAQFDAAAQKLGYHLITMGLERNGVLLILPKGIECLECFI